MGDNGDAFPTDPTETTDTDGDGMGDNADAFPNDPSESTDSDGDGMGDNSDLYPNDATETTDTDRDGFGDNADAFPNDNAKWLDSHGDGGGGADTSGGVVGVPALGDWSRGLLALIVLASVLPILRLRSRQAAHRAPR